jgi:hypothetical protein
MRLSFILYAGLLLALSNTSCNPLDGTTMVEGQVVDKYSGQGISNATVGVYSAGSSSMGGFSHKELEKQADSKGNFSFSFESEDERDYVLIASEENSYASNNADPLFLKEDRNNKKLKLKMEPYAWVRVKFVNTPPKDMVAELFLQSYLDQINGENYTAINYATRDTVFVRKVQGNKEHQFLYLIRDLAGNSSKTNPTLYFPALDTTDLILNY